jgi:hypothetical protein
MELSSSARLILELLVSEIRRGRFRPDDEGTFLGYKEVHDRLHLIRKGPNWGNSLRSQGLADLAELLRDEKLPAATGLIVGEDKPRRPGKGYFSIYGVSDGDLDWWRDQIRNSIRQDWSKWVDDIGLIDLDELREDSLSYIEGSTSFHNVALRVRCDALRTRAKELFRSPDGYLRCKVCGWHKPDARISGDIVEMHHIDPVSSAPPSGRRVTLEKAIGLLIPVCPTCHRMIHSRTGGGQFDIRTLRQILFK